MAIPDYQSVIVPLLRYARDKEEHSIREATDSLADEFHLTEQERKELLPSGRQAIFRNRVGWARTYLKMARLIESTRRGHFHITQRGLQVLAKRPERIDVAFLEQFSEFIEFKKTRREREPEPEPPLETPEESLESAFQRLRESLASELLETVKRCSPTFFERLVVDLLVRMGYGGSRKEAGQAIGRTGDEGIDGIIKEDRLGLDIIYVQAKRWEGTVGRAEIQKFAGALQGQRARKGIFITTASFSKDALDYASRIESKIILIGGQQLAELMIDHGVGVSPVASYEVKKIDADYFTEE
jgi:restriction system protein